MTETKPRVLFDNAYHARKRRDAKEIALLREFSRRDAKEIELLREALNAAIGLIDGIGRNVAPLVEERLEDELNEALHGLAEFGYTEEV